ncbi:hypothetical protein [Bradyrhizobium yuanmingense]|uniref:hypothetical protein n=1 Tax=Bradyrhizobium yuanmingense TaxID=108015 RepID=UPI0018DFDE1A|nr:hypothetical protein [Bradyrhizobium yuanmingense]
MPERQRRRHARRGAVGKTLLADAVAFSRTCDSSSGEFGDAKLIRKFGEVPDDLSAL